jgi:hypothetical protein
MTSLPRDVQQQFIEAASNFMERTGAEFEEVKIFMLVVIQIYHEFLTRPKETKNKVH